MRTGYVNVRLPLSDADLDRCLNAFLVFLVSPKPKRAARAVFTNANPPTEPSDLAKVTVFYRSDEQLLLFVGERSSGELDPDIDLLGFTALELIQLQDVSTLRALTAGG